MTPTVYIKTHVIVNSFVLFFFLGFVCRYVRDCCLYTFNCCKWRFFYNGIRYGVSKMGLGCMSACRPTNTVTRHDVIAYNGLYVWKLDYIGLTWTWNFIEIFTVVIRSVIVVSNFKYYYVNSWRLFYFCWQKYSRVSSSCKCWCQKHKTPDVLATWWGFICDFSRWRNKFITLSYRSGTVIGIILNVETVEFLCLSMLFFCSYVFILLLKLLNFVPLHIFIITFVNADRGYSGVLFTATGLKVWHVIAVFCYGDSCVIWRELFY